jgi:hypothetical protein
MTVAIERLSAVRLGDIGPVVGTQGVGTQGKPSRVEENAGGAAIVLDDQEIGALNQLAQVVKGDRGRQIRCAAFVVHETRQLVLRWRRVNHGHNHWRSSGQPASGT